MKLARARKPCLIRVCVLLGLCCWVIAGCDSAAKRQPDPELAKRGSLEVTARLDEIRGDLVDRPLYDYAFVMRYTVLEVHRGQLNQKTIYVGHYNPTKPRAEVADARVSEVGGSLRRFRAGDVHRIALESLIDEHYMGGIINHYFDEHDGPILWALWTNPG